MKSELRDALALLGKKRLALAMHDASFPSAPDEDVGRGSPYDRGAGPFLERMSRLGFDAIQLGPQGQTTRDNPSPYDGTVFSRSWLSIGLGPMVDEGLVPAETLEAIVAGRPAKGLYRYAYDAKRSALEAAYTRSSRLARQVAEYRERHRLWIDPDGLYDALESLHGGSHWRDWPPHLQRFVPVPEHEDAIDRWAFWQMLAERQHRELRRTCAGLGLALYGDLQVGLSPRDLWRWRELFLTEYRMGAPPSRTNPEGQAWGYPVLDPDRILESGLPFVRARMDRIAGTYDGLRIDHPHGLVCPWVYRASDQHPDAVKHGARLFCSPDHPELARYAIPRLDQIDPTALRWSDSWVRALDEDQIDRYAILFDAIVDRGGELVSEVLSTMPYPLGRMLARHGLGRFRVTQKANLDDPHDVYRSENARREDWIMVGTHDTKPIWLLAREWQASGEAKRQADYLAHRLRPRSSPAEIERFAAELAADRKKLVHAKFADIFASDAEHAMIFFSDLFGLEEIYNRPGLIHEDNWMLRVPPDLPPALDLGAVLALALAARGLSGHELVARLGASW